MKKSTVLSILFLFCILFSGCKLDSTSIHDSASIQLAGVKSKDGVNIAYSVYGHGDITIVFVHGWSCDSRYWFNQIPYFAQKYRVVCVDCAGHGNSGFGREKYTIESFGYDVAAVLSELDAENVILVGHSMGGSIVLQAAKIAPDRVIGVIGVDTLHDMGMLYTEEEKMQIYEPLAADFRNNTYQFVSSMFPESTNRKLVDVIARDMSSAPAEAALNALLEYLKIYDRDLVEEIDVPVKCVNSDFWPSNAEGNKELNSDFEMALMKGYGHFIMLEAPDEFNRHLDDMINSILNSNVSK